MALASSLELEGQLEELRQTIRELELDNTRLSAITSGASQRGLLVACISVISIVLMGIGVNIVTDKPYAWAGWVMIVASGVLQIIIMILRPKGK